MSSQDLRTTRSIMRLQKTFFFFKDSRHWKFEYRR